MQPFETITGPVSTLMRDDVDTDQIIPKQFLKRIERTGYGQFLFWDWAKDDEFPLNRPEFERAPILVAGANFGCGSSREHAACALAGRGFRAIVAPGSSCSWLFFAMGAASTVPGSVPVEPRSVSDPCALARTCSSGPRIGVGRSTPP